MSSPDYWRGPFRIVTLRRVPVNPESWIATGLVEKAWKRLDPPTRDHLAERLGLKAATNLTKMNTGTMPMSPEYADRIASVVPGITVFDLGAPVAVVAEKDPSALDRLQSLEAEVDLWKGLLLEALPLLGLRLQLEADPGSRVRKRAPRRRQAVGEG